MIIKKNSKLVLPIHHYKLEPGDMTMYRFSIMSLPPIPGEAYTISDGVGDRPLDYIWLAINMPGGVGLGTVPIYALEELPTRHIVGYLQGPGHGFGSVQTYTLLAVLLAAQVLVKDYNAVEEAAKNMLRVPEWLEMLT